MAEWICETTDAEIDAYLEAGKLLPPRPEAIAAEYDARLDLILLRLNDGRRLVIPREQLQGLETATVEQLSDIELFYGVNIGWRQLDVDHYLPHLLEGRHQPEYWERYYETHPRPESHDAREKIAA